MMSLLVGTFCLSAAIGLQKVPSTVLIPDGSASYWYLRRASDPPHDHRTQIKFQLVNEKLEGFSIFGGTREIPLVDLYFDGRRLSFRIQRPPEPGMILPEETPILRLELVDTDTFEGYYMKSDTESVGPRLRLTRFKRVSSSSDPKPG